MNLGQELRMELAALSKKYPTAVIVAAVAESDEDPDFVEWHSFSVSQSQLNEDGRAAANKLLKDEVDSLRETGVARPE